MEFRIRLRRAAANEWVEANPLLKSGEPGYEEDTRRLKIGDGVNHWNSLAYVNAEIETLFALSLLSHVNADTPHPVYDDGPDLTILYENAKV